MAPIRRRTFLAAASSFPFVAAAASRNTGIRTREVTFDYGDFLYRTPIKFGGNVVDRVTLLNVHCLVDAGGRTARGFGSMPLGSVWSFPFSLDGV